MIAKTYENRKAIFSNCEKYRYKLTSVWDTSKPPITYIMLNPSTADEFKNDPTIERCERRARTNGFGGMCILNLFAYRSTDPKELLRVSDPIGPDNDGVIQTHFALGDAIYGPGATQSKFVAAWGSNLAIKEFDRSQFVVDVAKTYGIPLYALKVNKSGSPAHPLYLRYDAELKYWGGGDE